ncbi:MAG: 6-phosphogluconolactonase [Melioribacteraceae bacterium]|nr:6-phosphogluconolactonase [Melioribacteraceae bacterium]
MNSKLNFEKVRVFSSPSETVREFADFLEELVNHPSNSNKYFNIALSGGNTPQLLFEELKLNYHDRINWSKLNFYWGDERCVKPESNESNYGNAKRTFLDDLQVPVNNIHRIKGENDPESEAESYSNEIKKNLESENGYPVFDLIILGLGKDGHTASIFPDQMHLLEIDKICEVATHPDSNQKRITLTGKVINNAKNVVFLITGEEKAEILSIIIEKKNNFEDFPASYINPKFGNLVFFVDQYSGKGIIK